MEKEQPKLVLIAPDSLSLSVMILTFSFLFCFIGIILMFTLSAAPEIVGGDSFNYILHRLSSIGLILIGIFLSLLSIALILHGIFARLTEFFTFLAALREYDPLPESENLEQTINE